MPTIEELEAENAKLRDKLSKLDDQNRLLTDGNKQLKEENKQLHEELASLKTTVSAVVARGIGANGNSSASSNHKKRRPPGRKNGHEGKSREKPEHTDARVELDETTCPKCGGHLSRDPTDEYTRVVEDIVPARVVVTEYVIKRRYCKRCGRQVSPSIPNVIDGGKQREIRSSVDAPHGLAEIIGTLVRKD